MDLLIEFLKHNTMMNRQLLDVCRGLSAEQLEATVEGTYGTIAATLVHIANAQVGYGARFHGTDRPEPLAEHPFPGMDAVVGRMALGDDLLENAAANANDELEVHVRSDESGRVWRMPGALLLLQAVNHGTEHRSQIATILTQIGIEPPAMDGWTYFLAAGHMVDESED